MESVWARHYEEELLRNPYDVKVWWSYCTAAAARAGPISTLFVLYERSVRALPRSYKLWHAYLCARVDHLQHRSPQDCGFAATVDAFERALLHMHKMPRIWLDYSALLIRQNKGTETRHVFDRALQSLPVTQHKELWTKYIEWARNFGVEDTAIRVYRRFLMFDPSQRESYVEYLEERGQYEEAARQLLLCVEDESFVSSFARSKHAIWMHLCNLCADHPERVCNSLGRKVEDIIRGGIARFSDEVGRLWCRLADYYTRLGQFEQARDVYEEAIEAVKTVRDFTIVFDAYVKVEESVLTAKIQLAQEEEEEDAAAGQPNNSSSSSELNAEIEMRLARLEFLMEKRPLQLSSVVLRQNPHNVFEWQKRIKLLNKDDKRRLLTYHDAIDAVDPQLAVGRLSGIWMSFAQFYVKQGDLENARGVWRRAVTVNFKAVDELAAIWCGWAEMEMHDENYEEALRIMETAVREPPLKKRRAAALQQDDNLDDKHQQPVSERLYKNVKVWSLYLDLEESLGTVETCRAAYDRVMDLKVITAQMALNYAAFLEEKEFFEDSFRVFERAVSLFSFPTGAKKIWLVYLDKFMARYEGTKLERLRDLFEQAVAQVPPEDAAEFYVKFAKAEEAFGLARHAMAVYDRATRAVPESSRLDMYRLYIKKIEQHFGITKTRPAYERAISELNDDMTRDICIDYAEMERKLGEIDRARAILQHGSQFADPRRAPTYWIRWREFEEAHGNEDTFRDMLRVQRSVETAFSQVNYLAAELGAGAGFVPATAATVQAKGLAHLEQQAELEAASRTAPEVDEEGNNNSSSNKRKFVPSTTSSSTSNKIPRSSEEIDIDDVEVQEKPVPGDVFGIL